MSIELDHIFWAMPRYRANKAIGLLTGIGLRESYRRSHAGQGTANVCFCFDNGFIELLWVEDTVAARSQPIARTKLALRERGLANPMGLAWRGDAELSMWNYQPPYLPANVAIPMAVMSDDPALPLLFSFPGSKPLGSAVRRQNSAGFEAVTLTRLGLKTPDMLADFAREFSPNFALARSDKPFAEISLTGQKRCINLRFEGSGVTVL